MSNLRQETDPGALLWAFYRLPVDLDEKQKVLEQLGANPHTPEKALLLILAAARVLWKMQKPNPLALRNAEHLCILVAGHANRSEDILKGVLNLPSELLTLEVVRAIAFTSDAPKSILMKLLEREPLPGETTTAARQEVLFGLARLKDPEAQLTVATHPETPPGLLGALLYDPAGRVYNTPVELRKAIAYHPNAEFGVLDHLRRDPDVSVRRTVYQHPKMPPLLLALSAEEEDDPLSLWNLAQYPHPSVQAAARKNQHFSPLHPLDAVTSTPETTADVVKGAVVAAVLKHVHPALALATEAGRDLAVADTVQRALKPG